MTAPYEKKKQVRNSTQQELLIQQKTRGKNRNTEVGDFNTQKIRHEIRIHNPNHSASA